MGLGSDASFFFPRQSSRVLQERRPGDRADRLAPWLWLHQHHACGASTLSAYWAFLPLPPSPPSLHPTALSPLAVDQPSLALFSLSLEWM